MALCEKILIAGFSGAGKSSLLKEIKSIAPVEWTQFDDLDQLVFQKRGKKQADLASLIEEVGWETFRLWERQELESWLKEEGKGVLALGGGALSLIVWDLYKFSRKIQFCYLKACFETCWTRLNQSEEVRPLLSKGKIELGKVFEEREKVYSQIVWQIENEESSILGKLATGFWERVALL